MLLLVGFWRRRPGLGVLTPTRSVVGWRAGRGARWSGAVTFREGREQFEAREGNVVLICFELVHCEFEAEAEC